MVNATYVIDRFQMQKHPEGGYYKQTYRSDEFIKAEFLPARFKGDRLFSTAIYFLLEGNDFSAFHRIRSDELWHFYYGSALQIFIIHPDGKMEIINLGNNLAVNENFQCVVKAGCWFAARLEHRDSFSLVGCTVSPGFDFADFELANREILVNQYPQHKEIIQALCR